MKNSLCKAQWEVKLRGIWLFRREKEYYSMQSTMGGKTKRNLAIQKREGVLFYAKHNGR